MRTSRSRRSPYGVGEAAGSLGGDRLGERISYVATERRRVTETETAAVVGGVVLAAGTSSRFSTGNKLLACVEGTPVVERVLTVAQRSALDDVVAVVGHEADAVTDAIAHLDVPTRLNDDYAAGQSASVRSAIDAARSAGWDAVVVLLGDMPFVRPGTIDELVETYRSGAATIVAPRYEGKRGNPVLFDRVHFGTLAGVDGDQGGRELVSNHDGTAFVETDDRGVRQDVDTEADLPGEAE